MISEVVCLTKTRKLEDMKEWLDWHINVCRFSLVHIIDNDSVRGLKELCEGYENVSYEFVQGKQIQYKLYREYAKKRMFKTNWILFIDDDEYFWFNPEKFNSVEDVIKYFSAKYTFAHMLAIRWKLLWPENILEKREEPVLKHNTVEYSEDKLKELDLFSLNRMCKTLVKLDGTVYYQTTEESTRGGHIPIHSKISSAHLINGIPVFNNNSLLKYKTITGDEDLRILHFKVTSAEEFMNKDHFSLATRKHNRNKPTDENIIKYIENLKREA